MRLSTWARRSRTTTGRWSLRCARFPCRSSAPSTASRPARAPISRSPATSSSPRKSASFIQAFCKIGLIPDSGGTYFLPRLVGTARAMGLALLGDKLPAQQAADWGLIWKCVDDAELAPTVDALLAQLAQAPTQGLVATRRALHAVGQRDAGGAARPRARPAARAGIQRRLSRRRRRVPCEACAAICREITWRTRCRAPRKSRSCQECNCSRRLDEMSGMPFREVLR